MNGEGLSPRTQVNLGGGMDASLYKEVYPRAGGGIVCERFATRAI